MTPAPRSARPIPRRLLLAATAGLLALAPASASAEESFPDPDGSGASVHLSSSRLHPGDRVTIRGEGFQVTDGGGGEALVAVKPYDNDPVWDFGGADAFPQGGSDSHVWFVARRPSGAFPSGGFDGWIDIPRTLTPSGLAGGTESGVHWLRILSGAFGTADGRTAPITYKVPFTVTERLSTGLVAQGPPTAPATGTFQAGTVFRPGAPVAVRGPDWTPGAPVTATLDQGIPGREQVIALPTPITTGNDGTLPASARVPLPGTTSIGTHTLTLDAAATGGAPATSATVDLRVTKAYNPASVDLTTPAVRPGGRFGFRVRDAVGVGGTGQKVAVVVDEVTLACVQADATGAASGTAVLPATTPTGDPRPASVAVGFATGTSCKGLAAQPSEVDLPGALAPKTLAASTTAPALDASSARAGASATVTGDGFTPGSGATAELDGAVTPASLSVDGTGRLAGTLPVPAGTTTGAHVLLVTAGATTAVALLDIAVPVAADPPAATPQAVLPPAVLADPPLVAPLVAPPTTTPKPAPVAPGAKALKLRGTSVRVTLTAPLRGATVTIRSAAKVRTAKGRRARVVTLGRARTGGGRTVDVRLGADGRSLLRRLGRVRVRVQVGAKGHRTRTETLVLRGR